MPGVGLVGVLVAGTTATDTLLRVDELPAPDTAERADRVLDAPGGCGANVAVALGRLGDEPDLLTAVGSDFAGSDAERRLERAGVALNHAVRAADERTARAVMTTDAEARQTIVYHEGATRRMRDLDPVAAELAHFAPGELSAYPALMAACERVTYDPGQETFYRDMEEVLAPIEHADVLLVNEHEADRIAEAHGGREALLADLEALVVTDRDGQTIHAGGQRERVTAVETDPVDPTGAGDAHSAGLLHGLATGFELADACRLGSVLAASAVEHLGAQGGLPDREQALARFERAYGRRPGS
jgi:ribokinase